MNRLSTPPRPLLAALALASCIVGPSGGCTSGASRALDIPADEAWTWMPIEGMQCADGSPGGVFANRTTRSDDDPAWSSVTP